MKWILLDANNRVHCCARAFYSSIGEVPVDLTVDGIIDSLLRIGMDERVRSNRYAVFFDSAVNNRKEMFPSYKANRQNLDRNYTSAVNQVFKEIKKLLPLFGFPVYESRGYEADDLIASAANWVSKGQECFAHAMPQERAVIISSDSDLHQCISESVDWYDYSRKKFFDHKTFTAQVGDPELVAKVKALTGCKSDGVPGVDGIGDVTAWKYVRGEAISLFRLQAIKSNMDTVHRNTGLVRLPLAGTPIFDLEEPKYDSEFISDWVSAGVHTKAYLQEWLGFARGRLSAASVQKSHVRKAVA